VTIDLIVLACLVLFAVFGAVTGALRQLLNLAAGLAGWLVARALGPYVADGLAHSLPRAMARPAASALLFVGTFVAVGIVGRLILRAAAGKGGPVRSPGDRGLGALIGAGQAGLAVWVLLSALVLLDTRVGFLDPRRSDFAALARDHNLLEKLDPPAVRVMRRLIKVMKDPKSSVDLRSDAEAQQLLDDPRVQSLLGSGGEKGTFSPEAMKMLQDPELSGKLELLMGKVPEIAE
jgi:membrane protein required for colicin V production